MRASKMLADMRKVYATKKTQDTTEQQKRLRALLIKDPRAYHAKLVELERSHDLAVAKVKAEKTDGQEKTSDLGTEKCLELVSLLLEGYKDNDN